MNRNLLYMEDKKINSTVQKDDQIDTIYLCTLNIQSLVYEYTQQVKLLLVSRIMAKKK